MGMHLARSCASHTSLGCVGTLTFVWGTQSEDGASGSYQGSSNMIIMNTCSHIVFDASTEGTAWKSRGGGMAGACSTISWGRDGRAETAIEPYYLQASSLCGEYRETASRRPSRFSNRLNRPRSGSYSYFSSVTGSVAEYPLVGVNRVTSGEIQMHIFPGDHHPTLAS